MGLCLFDMNSVLGTRLCLTWQNHGHQCKSILPLLVEDCCKHWILFQIHHASLQTLLLQESAEKSSPITIVTTPVPLKGKAHTFFTLIVKHIYTYILSAPVFDEP